MVITGLTAELKTYPMASTKRIAKLTNYPTFDLPEKTPPKLDYC